MRTQTTVGLNDARRVIAAAEQAAVTAGSPSNIAVVDAGGNLVAHVRMDDAQLGSISHSVDKALTAVLHRSPTQDLAADASPGGQFYGMALSNGGRVIVFAGGLPLLVDGEVVGGLGVSGGSGEQDAAVARAGAAAL